jgi:monoamine oxidase
VRRSNVSCPRSRVVVVGAGLAGLTAAEALKRAGIEVAVFETRDRVGGRVWSHTMDNGAVVELGAEFVLPGSDTVLALVERFGLGLWDKGMVYGSREPRGGIGVETERLQHALGAVEAALAETPPGTSASTLLAAIDVGEGAREAILARVEVSSAVTADRVDASELAGLAAHTDARCPSVAGGNQRIAEALAAELEPTVHLSCPVLRVASSATGVTVGTAGGELDASRVVLAVPASVIGRITFEPPLPTPLRSSYAAVEYGHAAKLFVPLSAPAEPSAVLSVPERYWTWTATGAGRCVQPVAHAFAGSAPALERLGVARGPERWLESLARLRPDLALDPSNAMLSTWDDDPWAQAAYSFASPPVEAWAGTGRLHACGEHTAGTNAALMEGALESGLRAAEEVLTALAARGADG